MTISEFESLTGINRNDIYIAIQNGDIDAYEEDGMINILWSKNTISFIDNYKANQKKDDKLGVCIKKYNKHEIYCRVIDNTNIYYIKKPDGSRVLTPFYNYSDAIDYCLMDTTAIQISSSADGSGDVVYLTKEEVKLILIHLPHNRFTDRLIRKLKSKLNNIYNKQKDKNNEEK